MPFRFALFEEEVAGSQRRIHCGFQVAESFGELRHFFHRHRVIGRELCHVHVDLQGFFETAELIERKTQAVERLWMIGKFLQGLTIRGDRLVPFLVPGGGVAVVHCFLKNIFSSGHSDPILIEYVTYLLFQR